MILWLALPASILAQSYTESILHSFPIELPNGNSPEASLIQASDGNLYGTTFYGGVGGSDNQVEGFGTIFKISPAGAFTSLYWYCDTVGNYCATGQDPSKSLVEGLDGNFYGVAAEEIYAMTPSGTATGLYSFFGGQFYGFAPNGLVQGSDGNFYGSTLGGGSATQSGTIFRSTPSGSVTTLYAFCADGGVCTDGILPEGTLVEASDGVFYGVTQGGGTGVCDGYGCGTVFKLANGVLTTLYSFCAQGGYPACSDGYFPDSGLVEGSDGNFYGVTAGGGPGYYGTIFKVSPAGALTTLYSFCNTGIEGDCPTGQTPYTNLIVGSDGKLYGITTGIFNPIDCSGVGCGTAFSITNDGTFNTIATFSDTDGFYPLAGLIQGNDGNFYGTLTYGGATYGGSIYKLTVNPPLPAPVHISLSDSQVEANAPVQMSWKVLNAFSATAQLCNAFVVGGSASAGTWTGTQHGTFDSSTKIYSGSATVTPTANGIYTYALTCGGSESGFASLRVGSAKAPTSILLQSTSPVALASSITLTATVVTQPYNFPVNAKVTFSHGSAILGTATPINGIATLTLAVPNIPPGTYSVVASYPGDENYQSSTTSANVVVLGYATTPTIAATPTTIAQGQSATITDTITRVGATGYPTGSVAFYSNQTVVAHADLVNGVATVTLPGTTILPPGTYPIGATYNGDALDQGAYDGQVQVTVIAATNTELTVSPMTVPANQTATLTAKVKKSYSSAVPTGKVAFRVNGATIATVTLDKTGTAVLTASDKGITPGSYPITAYYLGDATIAASVSTPVAVVVQ